MKHCNTWHTIFAVLYIGEWRPWAGICQSGSAGFRDAKKNRARFDQPHGICVTARGDVVIADTGNHCIRIISQEGVVTTLTGKCGHPGDVDGTTDEALFSDVLDVQCLQNCSVLVTEPGAGRIRLIKDTSSTCPGPEPSGQCSGVPWHWLLHWYILAGIVVLGLLAAANWYDARLAGMQAHLTSLLAEPAAAAAEASNTSENHTDIGSDTEQQASVARLRIARIFSLRRTNTMRRTQSDSLADHTYRTSGQRRADRAAQATRDAAAIMQLKRENQSNSPHAQYSQDPHGRYSQDTHGRSVSSPYGHDISSPHERGSSGQHAANLQHEHSERGLGTPEQSVDPNTDVFRLFDSAMSTPRGSGLSTRGSAGTPVADAEAGLQPRVTFQDTP